MTHFAIATLFNGEVELLKGTKEEFIKQMNDLSNNGSEEYSAIRIFPYSAYQTRRSFKQLEPKVKAKKNG